MKNPLLSSIQGPVQWGKRRQKKRSCAEANTNLKKIEGARWGGNKGEKKCGGGSTRVPYSKILANQNKKNNNRRGSIPVRER